MKVKSTVDREDIENGYSRINDYSPVDFNRFTSIKQEITGKDSQKHIKRFANTLPISIYAEGLNLPNYVLNDIYNSVEALIKTKYSFLDGYVDDFAQIASFLNRYSDNNKIWSEEFHKSIKLHISEIEKVKDFITKLDTEGIDIRSISVEFKENKAFEELKLKSDTVMKMWLNGFRIELEKYIEEYGVFELEARDTNSIQSEYFTPMLKAYFEMIYNEGLFDRFNSSRGASLFFGYLGAIAGAYINERDIYAKEYRTENYDKYKPLSEEEIDAYTNKETKYVENKVNRALVGRVERLVKTYLKQIDVDITKQTRIEKLFELCSLREYVIFNNIKASRIILVDFMQAVEIGERKFNKEKLDALLR